MDKTRSLQLLKPEKKVGYFEDGERYEYLHIPEDITKKTLEADIKKGAKQYQRIKELMEKQKDCFYSQARHFILVEAKDKEEGLAAVSYMMGEFLNCDAYMIWDTDEDVDSSLEEKDLQDENQLEDDADESGTEQEEIENDKTLNLENWAINDLPIISMQELWNARCTEQQKNIFQQSDIQIQGNLPVFWKAPYWMDTVTEAMVVTIYKNNVDYSAYYSFMNQKDFSDFDNCSKVFFLFLDKNLETEKEKPKEIFSELHEKNAISSFLLEFTADYVPVKMDKTKRERYERLLFRSWANNFSYELADNLPIKDIIGRIKNVDPENFSTTMEKMFKYIRHNEKACRVLNKEHFQIINILETEAKTGQPNASMDQLIGLTEIKDEINDVIKNLLYGKLRQEMGMKAASYSNVYLFLGAPGTAKTTFAKILGQMMKEKKLLQGSRFKSCTGAQLKGRFIGQTAPKIHEMFENYDIIFIDEAYSIAASDSFGLDSFSQEALAQLAVELEDHATDRLVIFAGYGGMDVKQKNNMMQDFLNANPGIRSRINHTFYFESYTPEEMVSIVHGIARQMDMKLAKEADPTILDYFKARVRDDNFGNGREARSLVENCQMKVADRIMKLPEKERNKNSIRTITTEDVADTIRDFNWSSKIQQGRQSFGFVRTF